MRVELRTGTMAPDRGNAVFAPGTRPSVIHLPGEKTVAGRERYRTVPAQDGARVAYRMKSGDPGRPTTMIVHWCRPSPMSVTPAYRVDTHRVHAHPIATRKESTP